MSYETRSFDARLVKLLKAGKVGVLPSDTIYGLSCRALDARAVERVYAIKHRDKDKPLVVLISSVDQLKELGIVTTEAAPALRYWPGKLTAVCMAEYAQEWLHRGTYTVAVRQPAYEQLLKLIAKIGPLISTSANPQGQKPAATISQAKEYFSDNVDFYVDAGKLSGKPSTLVKPVFTKLKVLRQGAVRIRKADQQ